MSGYNADLGPAWAADAELELFDSPWDELASALPARQRRAAQDHLRVGTPCGSEQRAQQVKLRLGSCGRPGWSTHKVHSNAGHASSGDPVGRGWTVSCISVTEMLR
jgi:hypothetical protein